MMWFSGKRSSLRSVFVMFIAAFMVLPCFSLAHKDISSSIPRSVLCSHEASSQQASRGEPLFDIVINEFMADPGSDHDGDGASDSYDEYIELFGHNL